MDSASHQKILGYFIEEAKEHLETLEQGLMELNSVVRDPERINEMFRAAHSIKGGSAMLGYSSIQKTAHRLEDCFKILKEHEVPVDQKLENLFLNGYETLNELLTKLESPFGLQDDEAEEITQAAEPDFIELQNYLNLLIGGGSPPVSGAETATFSENPSTSERELVTQIQDILKHMLGLFKQKATAQNRKELQQTCVKLAKLSPQKKGWQILTKSAYQAIANPKFSYRTLAPVVLKELKQGSDYIALGQSEEIAPSEHLRRLANAKAPQILMPVEPKAAAKTLKQAFNSNQLSQLVQLLSAKS
ncbi:MAG: Hpt domain-containing protein [Cyanobacteriota bacterium]|nr:Hpt domain-containing protein [Cyanobacteriota bacterium]